MPLLLVCVVLFFGIAQFYQWSSELTLPFPLLLLAGAGLAVISNLSDRRCSAEVTASAAPSSSPVSVNQTSAAPALPPDIRSAVEPRPVAEPQLPTLTLPAQPAQPARSISFELNPGNRAIASQPPQTEMTDSDVSP